MKKFLVAIVKYSDPIESVRKAVELSRGLDHFRPQTKVFIKPNIVFWNKDYAIPKYGSITTSRVIEDMVVLLKEHGIDDITIGEGTVITKPKVKGLQAHAFETLGYNALKKRYGIKILNIFNRPFEKVDLGDDVTLNFNTDIVNSDFVVNLPALKTHGQTIVSLGIKNLKGTIDIESRKKSHSPDKQKDLDFMVAKLANRMPPMFTLIDGIFSLELGPGYDGRARRSNILIASSDVLSADLAGARVLGFEASDVPHLVHAAKSRSRAVDLSDIELVGEPLNQVSASHEVDFKYVDGGELPVYLAKYGVKGISFPKPDTTMCTYCTGFTSPILTALVSAWDGNPWDDVEVLTGKTMKPTPGKKKTILLGKCIYEANKDNPDINEMFAVKGCPPSPKGIVKVFHKAGIPISPDLFEIYDNTIVPILNRRYEKKPEEFDESFFKIT